MPQKELVIYQRFGESYVAVLCDSHLVEEKLISFSGVVAAVAFGPDELPDLFPLKGGDRKGTASGMFFSTTRHFPEKLQYHFTGLQFVWKRDDDFDQLPFSQKIRDLLDREIFGFSD